ncbi:MAG: hypothetical protein KAU14_08845 [Thermoplasmata archaeon]|nr:hypothetical protein [Thermoplasmata archaeon]
MKYNSLEELQKDLKEDREIRIKSADWKFIEKQPLRIRKALEILVKTGDIYRASRFAQLTLDEMNDLRIEAKIPVVT